MKVTATITVEFDVPEGTNLEGAYTGIACDLFNKQGDLLASSRDVERDTVEAEDYDEDEEHDCEVCGGAGDLSDGSPCPACIEEDEAS